MGAPVRERRKSLRRRRPKVGSAIRIERAGRPVSPLIRCGHLTRIDRTCPGETGRQYRYVSWAGPAGTEAHPNASNAWEEPMPASKLAPCPDCGHLVSPQAEACPSCGRPLRSPASREGLFLRTMNQGTKLVFGILLFVVIFPIVIALVGYLLWH